MESVREKARNKGLGTTSGSKPNESESLWQPVVNGGEASDDHAHDQVLFAAAAFSMVTNPTVKRKKKSPIVPRMLGVNASESRMLTGQI
jgi:hypothetical protein